MRNTYVSRTSELLPIFDNYRLLEAQSRLVRYDLRKLRSDEIERLIDDNLAPIEQLIGRLLARPTRS
jgi:hypothetical protein